MAGWSPRDSSRSSVETPANSDATSASSVLRSSSSPGTSCSAKRSLRVDATSRCWTPSCKSRSRWRRAASPAATILARDALSARTALRAATTPTAKFASNAVAINQAYTTPTGSAGSTRLRRTTRTVSTTRKTTAAQIASTAPRGVDGTRTRSNRVSTVTYPARHSRCLREVHFGIPSLPSVQHGSHGDHLKISSAWARKSRARMNSRRGGLALARRSMVVGSQAAQRRCRTPRRMSASDSPVAPRLGCRGNSTIAAGRGEPWAPAMKPTCLFGAILKYK